MDDKQKEFYNLINSFNELSRRLAETSTKIMENSEYNTIKSIYMNNLLTNRARADKINIAPKFKSYQVNGWIIDIDNDGFLHIGCQKFDNVDNFRYYLELLVESNHCKANYLLATKNGVRSEQSLEVLPWHHAEYLLVKLNDYLKEKETYDELK